MPDTSKIENPPLLLFDDEEISLSRVLGYSQLFGKLGLLIQEIAGQHILYQELQQRDDLTVTASALEQAIIDFRLAQKLTEQDTFAQWLESQGMNQEAFQRMVLLSLKIRQLKQSIVVPELEKTFQSQKEELTQVELSCLFLKDKELITSIKQDISAGTQTFEAASQEYGETDDAPMNLLRGPTLKKRLPKELQESIRDDNIGKLLGPIAVGGFWCLFRVEKLQDAVLQGQLKRNLEEQIFKQWLDQKIKKLKIQLTTNNNQ